MPTFITDTQVEAVAKLQVCISHGGGKMHWLFFKIYEIK